ncbi:MAG TPA: HPF/RaiA family ribosome-associated protein [Stellaceae bacterium]|nr:HPF/RaiA family ribosome-associated protein [Stellaceae bacterium]
MELPIQITFRGMGPSEAVEARVRERVEDLNRFYDRITRCRVVVESGHRHQRKGRIFHVGVDLTVPGGKIVVKRDPSEHHAHEDVYVAIRDAFDAARRQLEDHARRARGDNKTHEAAEHGKVARLFPAEDYGFIVGADGQEIYMHRNSVVGGAFDSLRMGDEVRFVVHAGEGEKGPQASTVVPIGKHHLPPSSS